MASFTLIQPQTTADESADTPTDQYGLITFIADDLAGVEVIVVEVKAGSNYIPVTLGDGTPAVLDVDHPALPFEAGPVYRLSKGTTASPCGVYMNTKEFG